MNEAPNKAASNEQKIRGWANRILIASLAGILFLTLYPFEFLLHTSLPAGRSPFLLGVANKGGGALDVILNIFLFMPFGFGLATKLRRRGRSWLFILLSAWLAGAAFSYSIEFAQIYIPARDSGWEDIASNSTGSLVGWLLFEIMGGSFLQFLTCVGRTIGSWMIPSRALVILVLYFCGWLVYSPRLQNETHFGTWNQDCFLVFRNDATGRRPWKGRLLRAEIWDQAPSPQLAERLTSANEPSTDLDMPSVSFDFSSYPPLQKNSRLSIPLTSGRVPQLQNNQTPAADAISIASSLPVSDLITSLQRTNQFAVRIVFVPEDITDSNGRIVSISPPSGIPDLFVGQNNGDLFFWFRNRLSVLRPALAWDISKLLAQGQTRNMLFSYDGSVLRLFVDGKKVQARYWGPGTALASLVRRVKQGELNGYRDIFYAVLFVPIGCLLGVILRNVRLSRAVFVTAFFVVVLLAPALLESQLAFIDGRTLSISNLSLSILMILLGFVWINADSARPRQNLASSVT